MDCEKASTVAEGHVTAGCIVNRSWSTRREHVNGMSTAEVGVGGKVSRAGGPNGGRASCRARRLARLNAEA